VVVLTKFYFSVRRHSRSLKSLLDFVLSAVIMAGVYLKSFSIPIGEYSLLVAVGARCDP